MAFVLSRLRADPAEPVRADPEPGMQRRLDLPAPMELTLSGTARLRPSADDATIDDLVGAEGPVARSREHLVPRVAAAAAGSAGPEMHGFEERHAHAAFGEVQRRGEPGDAATHHAHIEALFSRERRMRLWTRGSLIIEILRVGLAH